MGGKVLEYEAKTIYRQGYKEGFEEGRREGIVSVLKEKNIPTQKILEILQERCGLTLETAKKYV